MNVKQAQTIKDILEALQKLGFENPDVSFEFDSCSNSTKMRIAVYLKRSD